MPSPRLSSAKLEGLFQNATDPLFVVNSDRRLVFVNRAWEELTGQAATEVLGRACLNAGPTRPAEPASQIGSFCPPPEAFSGTPTSALTLILHPSGERLWRRVEFLPLRPKGPQPPDILGLVRPESAPTFHPESESSRLRVELMEARHRLNGQFGLENLVGRGPRHRRLLDQIQAAAAADAPVVISGEPGTGKRQVARTIHVVGPRKSAPFVAFDCPAIPVEMLEREIEARDGVRGTARGDHPLEPRTILLVDLLAIPRDVQVRVAALLRGHDRWIATSEEDPDAAYRSGRIVDSLYYAFTTVSLRLAPLRDRTEDLPLLAQQFLERANLRGARQRPGFTATALDVLLAYDWPGNLRELGRVIDDAHGRGPGDLLDADDLTPEIRGSRAGAFLPASAPSGVVPLDERLMLIERRLIEEALRKARQNKSRAAELLGISRPRLYRRIKELGIPDDPEGPEVA